MTDEFTELVDARFGRVDLVGKAANGLSFLIAKAAAPSPADVAAAHYATVTKGKYTADELRTMLTDGHALKGPDGQPSYPIGDTADLDRAIHAVGRGSGDHDTIRAYIIRRAKALGAADHIPDNWAADGSIKKAATMTDTLAKADDPDLDVTTVLADPDSAAPGDPAAPGSPAWEAIDAATAMKWTAILYRALSALQVMADREATEAVTVDPSDQDAVFNLSDAAAAVDYAVGILAQFGADEWNESQMAAEADAVLSIGKAATALIDTTTALDTAEGYAPVVKAGRVLSAQNEAAIKAAVESLQGVLASLPTAPVTDETVTKEKETIVAESTTDEAPEVDVTKDTAVPTDPDTTVVKADEPTTKPTMQGVYDANGNLVGVCDPADITPLTSAPEPADSDKAEPAPETPDPAAPADPDNVGTPTDTPDVTKSNDERAEEAPVTKSVAELATEVAVLMAEIDRLGSRAPSRVFSNGQVPPAHLLRGQDKHDGTNPVAKSGEELRAEFAAAGTSPEQDAIAKAMNTQAVEALHALHAAN